MKKQKITKIDRIRQFFGKNRFILLGILGTWTITSIDMYHGMEDRVLYWCSVIPIAMVALIKHYGWFQNK